MTERYSIYAFDWDKSQNTFICESPHPAYHPIDRKEFYIVNEDSGGFRRFRYVKAYSIDGEFGSVGYNLFQSEDGIYCRIKIIQ